MSERILSGIYIRMIEAYMLSLHAVVMHWIRWWLKTVHLTRAECNGIHKAKKFKSGGIVQLPKSCVKSSQRVKPRVMDLLHLAQSKMTIYPTDWHESL